MRHLFWLTLALTLAVVPSSRALACPNCKEAVAAQPEEAAAMARGYNWSVLLMLVMPASLIGTGGLMVHRAVKRGLLPEM
jgi:hypothetical protein